MEGEYSGRILIDGEVEKLDKMCSAFDITDIAYVLNDILKASQDHTYLDELDDSIIDKICNKGGELMVIYQNYTTVEGVERVKAYLDKNVYIERDGALYSEVDDFAYQQRVYAETDIPIEPVEESDEIEQKAAAFDYLTGRSAANE